MAESPRDRLRRIARDDGIEDSVADDFASIINFESGSSHRDRRGKVRLSPPDPKTGESAVGIAQIKPSTAREMGIDDPFDEDSNLKAGLRYFSKAGSDPTARRIHYFGGPGALQRFQKTGRVPQGQDVLGTTFQKYIQQTGGQQKPKADLSDLFDDPLKPHLDKPAPQQRPRRAAAAPSPTPAIDLSAGLEDDDLFTGLGQTPTPQQRRAERLNEWVTKSVKQARQSSAPLQLKNRPQFAKQHHRIRTRSAQQYQTMKRGAARYVVRHHHRSETQSQPGSATSSGAAARK